MLPAAVAAAVFTVVACSRSASPPATGLRWADRGASPPGLNSISCPAIRFCVAVDDAGYACACSGGRWSAGRRLEVPAGSVGLSTVSCPSEGFCAAIDEHGHPFTYAAGRWSAGPPVLARAPYSRFYGISCASAGYCAALATYYYSDRP